MNYLVHSYLSFSEEQIAGQFLQDFIRNRERFSFSEGIQQGIVLHRVIDTFTDQHPEIHLAKKLFSPLVRLYAGAFVDVAFDYFLANTLDESSLKTHSQRVYQAFRNYESVFPEMGKKVLRKMAEDDWLFNYRYLWGINFSMKNVLNKARYLDKDLPIFEVFLAHQSELKSHFDVFFPELEQHILQWHQALKLS